MCRVLIGPRVVFLMGLVSQFYYATWCTKDGPCVLSTFSLEHNRHIEVSLESGEAKLLRSYERRVVGRLVPHISGHPGRLSSDVPSTVIPGSERGTPPRRLKSFPLPTPPVYFPKEWGRCGSERLEQVASSHPSIARSRVRADVRRKTTSMAQTRLEFKDEEEVQCFLG